MDIEKQIINSLEMNGVNIEETNIFETNIFSEMNSLQYIAFISDIERNLGIEIPEEHLIKDKFETLREFTDQISDIYDSLHNEQTAVNLYIEFEQERSEINEEIV